jgi:hypothetical protein
MLLAGPLTALCTLILTQSFYPHLLAIRHKSLVIASCAVVFTITLLILAFSGGLFFIECRDRSSCVVGKDENNKKTIIFCYRSNFPTS